MRKFIVILLTVLLTVPHVTFAKEMDQELKAAILKVKNIIEVPEELTQFSYEVRTEGKDENEKYFSMQWYDEKNEMGRVDIQADVEGNIIRYYASDFKETGKEEIKASYDEGLTIAKAFISKVMKNATSEIKEGRYVKPNQGNTYTYIFDEYVNGVKVYQRSAYVEVEKTSGEVVSFSGFEPFKGTYDKKEKVISLEEAQKAYLEKIGLKLLYKIDKDYKTKTMRTFPAYVTDNLNNRGINAVTGEVTAIVDREYELMKNEAKESTTAMDAGTGDRLTPEEEKAVNEINGLITSQEAVAKAAKYFPNMAYVAVNNAYLYKDIYNGRYEWHIQLSSIDEDKIGAIPLEKLKLMLASGDTTGVPEGSIAYIGIGVDVRTGEVLRYSAHSAEDDKEKGITYEASRKKVESFLQVIAPNKYKEVKGNVQLNTEEETEGRYHRFSYDRMVKGVPVDTNGFYVTYDSVKQEIVSYSNTWDKLEFQDIDQIISKEEIIKKLGLELMYIPKDDHTRLLAYITPDNTVTFDPFTGNRINGYDGKPYMDESIKVVYDDIAGHKMESIIKKLYDRGIQLEGKSFKPDSKITQVDFMRMLMGTTDAGRTDDMVYDYAIRQGILSKEEVQKDRQVTALEATKYIIHKLGYKEVAQLKDIYVLPFADNITIAQEAKGYIALGYGLGIIDAEDLKLVTEKTTVSRAQSARMIYQMLIK